MLPRSLFAAAFALCLTAPLACAQKLDPQQVDALGSDLFAQSSSTGMVLVVVEGREAVVRGYGETAPGSGVKPGGDSVLRLCSLSKIFATDLLTKLAADGTVALNDPLQRFAPPHTMVPARAARGAGGPAKPMTLKPITLKMLATHTAGLPREVGPAPRGTPHFTFPSYAYRWRWLPKQTLKTTPGTAALYSNIGFDLLGDALERAVRLPYAVLFSQRIAHPLGLRDTGFTPNAGQCARLLQGVRDEGECTDTQNSAASAGVYSTGNDMVRWLGYLLGTGVVPGKPSVALPAQDPAAQAVVLDPHELASQQGLDHAGEVTGIGLGWMHVLPLGSASEIVEKTGGGAGFTTYIALNQPSHIGLFVAFTDGATMSHYNVFKAANNIVLTLAGLPTAFDPSAPKPAPRKPARKRTTHARH